MIRCLYALLGVYTKQYVICSVSEFEFLATALLFSLPLKRKRHYAIRLISSFAISLVLIFCMAVLRTHYSGLVLNMFTVFALSISTLPLLLLCYDESIFTVIRTWCAGAAAMEIGAIFYSVLLVLVGNNGTQNMSFFGRYSGGVDWLIYFAIHFALYFIVYWIAGRRHVKETDAESSRLITGLAVVFCAIMVILDSITSVHRTESTALYGVVRVYVLLTACFILILRAGFILQSQAREEMAVMDQVMNQQRRQYESIRENINIVNMRCHDLKHQLANLAGKLTDEEVRSLQEAMNIYDSTIKTGSEVLDVVLYEYQLTCQQEHIQLSCLADGGILAFMRTRHIYALFSNALRNAVEAVRKVSDQERRIISINVEQVGDRAEITVTNYCTEMPDMPNDLPSTTKADRNHHGFGIMSMKYIAGQYRGAMSTNVQNGIFTLSIAIPLPSKA